jgi:electron transfer flavoprotein alpha subunit
MPDRVLAILTETGPAGLTGASREGLGLAATAAEVLGGDYEAAIFAAPGSEPITEAIERGAARVFALGERPAGAEAALAAAVEAVSASEARVVVFNRGPLVLDLVPRLAARLGGGCVMGVTEVRAADGDVCAVAAVFGGAARAIYAFKGDGPRVISAAAGAAEAPERTAGRTAEVIAIQVSPAAERIRVVEPVRAAEGPRLEDARVVVSGGRGLRGAENYALIRELAEAMGGMPGASRAIVDDAWATPAQQVGLTGKIVTPQVYIAAGISGASQHMAGCANSKTLIAINTDPEAPIFRYAHFGVVENCLEVLPELIRLAKARTSGG